MPNFSNKPPIALTIAGSDSGGGAGIQADLKAFSANGVYGASVITAVTAQNTTSLSHVHAVPIDVVTAQILAVLNDLDVRAIKIGMLFSAELIIAVAQALKDFTGSIVLDPVMVSKSGNALLQPDAVAALKEVLIPRADIVTPNYPEAMVLLGLASNTHIKPEDLSSFAHDLLTLGAKNILLKGGHGTDTTCTDVLLGLDVPEPINLTSTRVPTKNTHGTGCTYSSSIAAYLANGITMAEAVSLSHNYLHNAILCADQLDVGHGHGPVHHFYHWWKQ